MPSPVAHTLSGFLIATSMPQKLRRKLPSGVWGIALTTFWVNLPDIDFLFGIPGPGRFDRFHHGFTHSIGFGLILAFVLWLILRLLHKESFTALFFLMLFMSHLFLDLITVDKKPPIGIPLFWPISSKHFLFPVSIFTDMERSNLLMHIGKILTSLLREVIIVGIPLIFFKKRLINLYLKKRNAYE